MFENVLVLTAEDGTRWEALCEDTNGLLVLVPLGTPVFRLDPQVPTEDEQKAAVEEIPEA